MRRPNFTRKYKKIVTIQPKNIYRFRVKFDPECIFKTLCIDFGKTYIFLIVFGLTFRKEQHERSMLNKIINFYENKKKNINLHSCIFPHSS